MTQVPENLNLNVPNPEEHELVANEPHSLCIFGLHISDAEKNSSKNVWSAEVTEQVTEARPRLITVDGLSAGTFADLRQCVPLENIFTSFPENGKLTIVQADLPSLTYSDSSQYGVVRDQIRDALRAVDPSFAVNAVDINQYINARVDKATWSDILLFGGVGVFASLVKKVAESQKEDEDTERHTIDRRKFIKIGLGVVAGLLLGVGKASAYKSALQRQERSDTSTDLVLNTVGRILRPILGGDGSDYVKLRNIRMGLGTIACIRETGLKNGTAAIVLGTGHKIETYPGQDQRESLTQTEARLLNELKPFIKIAFNGIKEMKGFDPQLSKRVMREIFSAYNFTEIPQTDVVPKHPSFSFGENKYMESVDRMIEEVFGAPRGN